MGMRLRSSATFKNIVFLRIIPVCKNYLLQTYSSATAQNLIICIFSPRLITSLWESALTRGGRNYRTVGGTHRTRTKVFTHSKLFWAVKHYYLEINNLKFWVAKIKFNLMSICFNFTLFYKSSIPIYSCKNR